MKSELLISLRTLRSSLDEGRISPEEYQDRRQHILDSFEPPSREMMPAVEDGDREAEDQNHTVNELLEDTATVSDLLAQVPSTDHDFCEAETVALDPVSDEN